MSFLSTAPSSSDSSVLVSQEHDALYLMRLSGEYGTFHGVQRIRDIVFTSASTRLSKEGNEVSPTDLISLSSWKTPRASDLFHVRFFTSPQSSTPVRLLIRLPDAFSLLLHVFGNVTIPSDCPRDETIFDATGLSSSKFDKAKLFMVHNNNVTIGGFPNVSPSSAQLCFETRAAVRPDQPLRRMLPEYALDWMCSPWNDDWTKKEYNYLYGRSFDLTSPVLSLSEDWMKERVARATPISLPMFIQDHYEYLRPILDPSPGGSGPE